MAVIDTVAPGRFRIRLDPPSRAAGPWATAVHVHVLQGRAGVALVDTGPYEARDTLREALRQLGIQTAAVQRIALTDLDPFTAGNVEIFDQALPMVVSAQPEVVWRPASARLSMEQRLLRAAKALAGEGMLDLEAGEQAVARLLGALWDGVREPQVVSAVPEGTVVALGGTTLEAVGAPGVSAASAVWREVDDGDLFGGRALVFDERFPVADVGAMIRSLDRISQHRPRRILPLVGDVSEDYKATFRSLGLLVHGALSHLPYAFAGATRAIDLAWRDPADGETSVEALLARTLRYEVLLDELVRTGIVEREGEGPAARHHGGTAQGSRTAALLEDLRARRQARAADAGRKSG